MIEWAMEYNMYMTLLFYLKNIKKNKKLKHYTWNLNPFQSHQQILLCKKGDFDRIYN